MGGKLLTLTTEKRKFLFLIRIIYLPLVDSVSLSLAGKGLLGEVDSRCSNSGQGVGRSGGRAMKGYSSCGAVGQ